MLSLIFVPIMVQLRRRRMNRPGHGRVIVSGLPLEEAFSATIATAGLLSTSIATEAAKVGAKSSVNGGLRLNLEEDVGKNEVVSSCSKSHEQLKKWNEQPVSVRKQIQNWCH
jgi:hypothetical protein